MSNGVVSHEDVQEYYSQVVKCKTDLKTDTCQLGPSSLPKTVKAAIGNVHEEILNKYYGCGLPVPVALKGIRVLDLGSGTGRDVYVLSQLVGKEGFAVGVDMTEGQLEVARKYLDHHMTKFFGSGVVNVDFKQGFIEKLEDLGMDNQFDLVISNCVINLAMDKKAVLQGAKNVLKEGGEVYFSDIYSSAPVPENLRANKDLWGECLSGALYWQDLHSLCQELGFTKPILVDCKPVTVDHKGLENEIEQGMKDLKFSSVTYRFFKAGGGATTSNETTTSVTYQGGIEDSEECFKVGYQLLLKKGETKTLSAELASILKTSRYSKYLSFEEGKGCNVMELPVLDPFVIGTSDSDKKQGGGCAPKKCC